MVVNFYSDINMTYFLNSHIALLYLHDKLSVPFWKVTMNTFLKKNPSIFFNIIVTKVYYNMDNSIFDNFNVEYDFTF
jgi:hypothetical protein